jgi:hypothetical protein
MEIILLQLIVPLLLIGWLAAWPARNRAGWLVQLLATLAYLAAMHMGGRWLALPWWMAWVLWALFALALVIGRRPSRGWPGHWFGWLLLPLWAALGAMALVAIVEAWRGLAMPVGPVADLALPLPPGRYAVANGGADVALSPHIRNLAPETELQRRLRGQSYAIDLVALNRVGRHARGLEPRDPARYAIWNLPVLAPCAGRVVRSLDGRPDMPVPEPDAKVLAGNHILLRCGRFEVLLAHLRRGSVRVRPGDAVRRGDPIARVGNSGYTRFPHLHLGAQHPGTPAAPFASAPVPLRIGGRYLVRGDRL